MRTYRNIAIGDARRRKGERNFTDESFYDVAHKYKGTSQSFAMFLSYGEDFIDFAKQGGWSVKGWSGEAPAYFTDVPVDFDASDNLEAAYEQCKKFVDDELIGRGIDTRYFVIYLSGGKGFHVHISAGCFMAEQPVENAGYRLKLLATTWKVKYSRLDLSIYNSTALFRLPGSKHKSGLHKVEIPYNDFNLEYIERRAEWASEPPASIRIPELNDAPLVIELPELQVGALNAVVEPRDFDADARIVPNCAWLRQVLADPSGGGDDGVGRDRRRNAVGILLTACEVGEHNPELQAYIDQLFEHPYMVPGRQADTMKWVREYDRDGEIKCKKTCVSVGCSYAQRKICGTKSPLDWKLKTTPLETITVAKARQENEYTIRTLLENDDNGIHVLNWPVGIGKTFGLIGQIREHGYTAFYVAQTHLLANQTHANFLDAGIDSRHIASRTYLSEHEGFECVSPVEVQLAMENGYGSHTVCSKCPRKRKRVEDSDEHLPDDGYEPCEYFEQFEGLENVGVVVGVHNHLMEFMYDSAGVAQRSVTVIDESPLDALSHTIEAIEPEKLAAIRTAMDGVMKDYEQPEIMLDVKPAERTGLFARVALVMDRQMAEAALAEHNDKLPMLRMFLQMYAGQPVDIQALAQTSEDYVKACWYEFAGKVAERSGLREKYALLPEHGYLSIPYPVRAVLDLAARNIIYSPACDHHIPAMLPNNKIIVLDATASNDVYAKVFGRLTDSFEPRPYKFYEHQMVEQRYSHTTQITTSSYGVGRLYDEGVKDVLQEALNRLMKKHPGPSLIVVHKQHLAYWQSAMADRPEVSIATYGSLKGLNHWSHCVAQYIVGTPFVPDHGIAEAGEKLGFPVGILKLQGAAALKRLMLRAKNGDTAVVSRRVYGGYDFHTALAQMKSQWEVTQAVRLRLYDDPGIGTKQHLYIFSNVELKGMYADELMSLDQLYTQTQEHTVDAELEVRGGAFDEITEWFKQQPKGFAFKRVNIPQFASDSFIKQWLMAAVNAKWVEKQAGYTYVKLIK